MSFFSKSSAPIYIAGPCSVESEAQLHEIATAFKSMPIQFMRAGVWKPRTRPGSFEGLGEQALLWLSEIKKEFQIPIAIEVAEPAHVELALRYDVDVVWLGARTVVNPFQVQRLADALQGVQLPVMIKNPVTPDVDLWIGAIERMEKVGITDIAAVHRGFSTYAKSASYRNEPNWIIPIELKRRRPELILINDPSHITGQSAHVAAMAQRAMDMGFDGLMIETHPNPSTALSDAAQQITPAALAVLIQELKIRTPHLEASNQLAQLDFYRQLMDSVDDEIIALIARRMELSNQLGVLKKEMNLSAYQPERWREIIASKTHTAALKGLDPQLIKQVFEQIHDASINHQLGLFLDSTHKK
jgi:chorismate mutase